MTFSDWADYFQQNAREPDLPWADRVRLSGAERLTVIPSIQQFQLGEGASGVRMLKCARRSCGSTEDSGLMAALTLFLQEEQRHSRILAQFLQRENVHCLRKHWVHSMFRWIRGLAGLELCLKVLVTAELLARPYYAALRDATASPLLRSICQRILDEEAAHLRFQAFALRRFQSRHFRPVRALIKACHVLLLTLTAAVVWTGHDVVFRSAGWTLRRFREETWQEFDLLYRT